MLGRFVGAICFALLFATPLTAQEFKNYGKGSKIVKHSTIQLDSGETEAFEWFIENPKYFGAIAVHKSGDLWASFRQFQSLEAARYFALLQCQEAAKNSGLDPKECTLYASAIPKTLSSSVHKAKGLPEKAQPFLLVFESHQEPGHYGAFAISDPGGGGWSYGQKTEALAKKRALAECERNNKAFTTIHDINSRAYRRLIKEGWFDCFIIMVHRP